MTRTTNSATITVLDTAALNYYSGFIVNQALAGTPEIIEYISVKFKVCCLLKIPFLLNSIWPRNKNQKFPNTSGYYGGRGGGGGAHLIRKIKICYFSKIPSPFNSV